MPTEISVSMVAAPWRRFDQAARWKGHAPQHHHRCREREREPLPVVELQRRDHRHHQHGQRQQGRHDEALAQADDLIGRRPHHRRRPAAAGRVRAVTELLDSASTRRSGGIGGRLEVDGGLLGGVVDRGGHAVEAVEALLDAPRARRARHADDRQFEEKKKKKKKKKKKRGGGGGGKKVACRWCMISMINRIFFFWGEKKAKRIVPRVCDSSGWTCWNARSPSRRATRWT